jgi:hypothetical protein
MTVVAASPGALADAEAELEQLPTDPLGAQSRSAMAVSRISAIVAAGMDGLLSAPPFDLCLHQRRWRSRCHRSKVAGWTISSACRQAVMARAAVTIHQREASVPAACSYFGTPAKKHRHACFDSCRPDRHACALDRVRPRR